MYEYELEVATSAVRQACRICRDVRRSMVTEDAVTKQDRSPVTVADFSAQAVMSHILHGAFPNDPLMAEEDTTMLRGSGSEELRVRVMAHVQGRIPELTDEASMAEIDRGSYGGGPDGRFWTMDPIDGTKGYIRGDQYAVALALLVDGEVVLSVMGCPHLPARYTEKNVERGLLFYALRGSGTNMQWLHDDGDAPIAVSSVTDPAGAVICQSLEAAHTAHSRADLVAERLGIQTESLRLDSQCKYGLVARGEGTIYMRLPASRDYEEKLWDHAAGWIIVKEAGGEVTDLEGKPLDFTRGRTLKQNRGIIATNGHIHASVLDAVGAVVAEV